MKTNKQKAAEAINSIIYSNKKYEKITEIRSFGSTCIVVDGDDNNEFDVYDLNKIMDTLDKNDVDFYINFVGEECGLDEEDEWEIKIK